MPIQTISKRGLFHTERDMTSEQKLMALEEHSVLMRHEIMSGRLTREDAIWRITRKYLEVYGTVTITEDEESGEMRFDGPIVEE